MKKVIVYSKDYCPYCTRAKSLLESKGVEYEEIEVDVHPEQVQIMIEKAHGLTTVPQIFIDDFHVGGCDDLFELENKGELDGLLQIEATGEKNDKKEQVHRKVIILGTGPAGYTAAIYAARANLQPLVIAGPQKGGQLTTTTLVDNFPGFPEGVDGNQLMYQMEEQAQRFDAEVVYGEIDRVDLSSRPFKLFHGDTTFSCDALIIATGATAKYLGLESEERFKNRGVSACATCDGFFFKGKEVAVVGGGDTALEEAAYLTNFCDKVILIHRRDELRGSKPLQERVKNNPKIEILWNTVIDEVIGNDDQGMTDLQVRHVKDAKIWKLGVSGLFVAIGHRPNTKLFEGVLDLDVNRYLLTQTRSSKVNVEGVFACGDVADSIYRQAVTAAGSGCMAAIDAERWLSEQ
jgi:thioredoxin reductase (NADPH)